MCGFLVKFTINPYRFDQSILMERLSRLTHRGPDQKSIWKNENIWMGHQRLILIGGEDYGRQPLVSPNGNALVYNGEIYNCQELQSKYLSSNFLSDSEILFALLNKEGESILPELRGMFSFVYYRHLEKQVWLVRDPFGMKPLYYRVTNEGWEFSSELKAFDDLYPDKIQSEIFHYHMAPLPGYSLYENVFEVRPGSIKIIGSATETSKQYVTLGSVFDLANSIRSDDLNPSVEELYFNDLFDKTVRQHLFADIPPGMILSGGIDSGCIAMSLADSSVKAYTMSVSGMDESSIAASLADALDINHKIFAYDLSESIEDVLNAMDGPIGDASFFPTWNLFNHLKNIEKSVLGGDGGDELFYGYPTFEIEALRQKLPSFIFSLGRKFGSNFGGYSKERVNLFEKLLRFSWGDSDFTMFRQMQYMAAKPIDNLSPRALELVLNNLQQTIELEEIDSNCQWSQVFTYYFRYYLATQVLTKSDRASMSHSIELRCPYLDWELFSNTFRFPKNTFPFLSGRKQVLRDYYNSHRKLKNPSKRGFSAPLYNILPKLEAVVANQRDRGIRTNDELLENPQVGLHARYLELVYEYFHDSIDA